MIETTLLLIPWIIHIILTQREALQALQQNTYDKDNRYFNWIKKNLSKIFLSYEILIPIILVIFIVLKINYIQYGFSILYIILDIYIILEKKKQKQKLPLVVTARVKRIILFLSAFYFPFLILYNPEISPLLFSFVSYFSYFILLIINKIEKPIEKIIYNGFKNDAQKILNSYSDLKVIGITGSYGKTSSKNIINTILSEKYNPLTTPNSFNTPYGLIRTIRERLTKFNNIFIAEMAAKKQGEIKELCDLVSPTYGVLTKIGPAHLESFKTIEVIQQTKFELIESLPRNGIAILNKDDKYQTNYKIKNKCKKVWISIDNKDADVIASNVKIKNLGMEFTVDLKKKEKIKVFTRLLGKHNIYNILGGIALAKELGLTNKEIEIGIKKINPTQHRLELKQIGDNYIIDDAFNSNPEGSSEALEILNKMQGNKIIITPGMIELGDKQDYYNKELGKKIADVCDAVILIGDKQTKAIQEGLKAKKYDEKNIFIYSTFNEGFDKSQKLAKGNSYILIENDLPDIYNE